MTENSSFRSGYASIIGRPNVGKSTLLNTILGQKVSIVTDKPQTTRNRIIGIKHLPHAQVIFIDTPGFHRPQTRLGEFMMREAKEAMREVDVVLFMAEPRPPGDTEDEIIKSLAGAKKPVFLLLNKIDTVKKSKLLPVIEEYSGLYPFQEIIPLSAKTGEGIETLLQKLLEYLPEGPEYYPEELVTDQLERFMVSEIIREKIMEATREEVPHSIAVDVVRWEEAEGARLTISADIWVEREGQKGIIIGKHGQMLKAVGQSARVEIEDLLNAKVFLELWVKVKRDWREDIKSINELGIR